MPGPRSLAPARTLSRGSRVVIGTATVVVGGANVAGASSPTPGTSAAATATRLGGGWDSGHHVYSAITWRF